MTSALSLPQSSDVMAGVPTAAGPTLGAVAPECPELHEAVRGDGRRWIFGVQRRFPPTFGGRASLVNAEPSIG